MDIAIGQINRRAEEDTFGVELRPLVGGEDFERGGGIWNVGHERVMTQLLAGGKGLAIYRFQPTLMQRGVQVTRNFVNKL